MASSHGNGGDMAPLRSLVVPVSIAVAIGAIAGCGSDDTSEPAAEPSADGSEAPADGDDDAAVEPDAGDVETPEEPADAGPTVPADGRYRVGDTYTDGEFDAVYLGLVEVPLGPDIWPDGACYAIAWDATYLDPAGFGSDEFRPSIDAYLTDGRQGDDDQTGVGCDQTVLPPAGYARGIETMISAGETVRIYSGPFRVAAADIGMIDIITLFGSGPETGLDPEVTSTLTGG